MAAAGLPDVIGVVGAGTMGAGIAELAAEAGIEVQVYDPDESVAGSTDMQDLRGCTLVVEAAPERLELKRELFARLDALTRPDVVLSSNTSSISITALGAATNRPDKVLGMHFMNPVPLMKLVEVIRALTTSDETGQAVVAFAQSLGKEPITAPDRPGFIVNRLLVPYLFDAIRLYEKGSASREDIDTAMRLGLAHPMGPLTLADLIGLDTLLAIGEVLREAFPADSRYEAPKLLRDLVAEGKLGTKSGGGFYDA